MSPFFTVFFSWELPLDIVFYIMAQNWLLENEAKTLHKRWESIQGSSFEFHHPSNDDTKLKRLLDFHSARQSSCQSWLLSLFLNHQIFVSCQRDYQCLAQHDISFCWKQHFYHPTVLQFTSPEECYIISVYKFVFIYIFVFVFVCSEQSTIVNLCQRIAASTSLQNMNETREGMTHISNTFMSNSHNIINSVNNMKGFKVLSLLTPNSLHEHDLNPTISSVLM